VLEWMLFAAATAGLVWVSWASLRTPRSHGFYRFFAWESLLLLLLLNMRRWFDLPFSPHQLVSWPLLTISLFLFVESVRLLRKLGKPSASRDDKPLLGAEKTTVLVTDGLYRHIRHPMYSSLLFLGWGIFFKLPSWLGGLLAFAATAFLVVTARVEERENTRYFGDAYRAYADRTDMFIPRVL
jgi:protein-S-isoprenylcysteine O-methyltransferase Ste14